MHPLPVAEAWDGERWTVDLAYRTRSIDIETTSTHRDRARARQYAYSNLKRLLA